MRLPFVVQSKPASSRRAGCIFPVARVHRFLKSYATTKCRVGGSAGIFTAAVMEYLAAEAPGELSRIGRIEVLELAGNVCAAGQPRGDETAYAWGDR